METSRPAEPEYGGKPHERLSPYAGIGHDELIDRFYETEGDPDIGRELSVRLFEHAEFTGDPSTVPLIGRDGSQINDEGNALSLADYVNFAANHHSHAIEDILGFLTMEKGSPDYETLRATVVGRFNGNRD